MTDAIPGPAETSPVAAAGATAAPVSEAAAAPVAPAVEQASLAAPPPAPRGLSYAVDIVFGVDVTGSMTPILDQVKVKANALRLRRRAGEPDGEGQSIDE